MTWDASTAKAGFTAYAYGDGFGSLRGGPQARGDGKTAAAARKAARAAYWKRYGCAPLGVTPGSRWTRGPAKLASRFGARGRK